MKDFKGTPGPWTMNPVGSIFSHPDKCVVKRDDFFDWVATVQVSNMPQWEANGKAIAAVPEMIEALQEMLEAFRYVGGVGHRAKLDATNKAKAALSKALD